MPDNALDLSDIAEPAAPRRRVQPRNLSDPLDTIAHYESGDQNVPNYRFDRGHTAQGNYQITNTNWRSYAPKVGIDTAQYPSAMKAPKEVQRKVADTMFSEHGFGDWAPYNPALRQALKRGEGGGKVAFAQPSLDLSDIAEPAATPQTPSSKVDLSDIVEGGAAAAKPARQPRTVKPRQLSMGELKQADESHIQATDKLSRDIAWHFGDSVLNQFNDLPEDRQVKIARLASQYATADEDKRRKGQPITESYDWKRRNQQMVGVTGDSVIDRGEMMMRQQGLTNEDLAKRRADATASTNPLLKSTGVMRWLKETGAQGTAGLLDAVAGTVRLADHGASPAGLGAREIAGSLQEKSNQLRGVAQQAEEREPMGSKAQTASNIGAGLVSYAPLMLLGHPEGALASMGTGAATFGGYSGLQEYGQGGTPTEALKEGAKAAPFGALMGVPGRTLGTAVDNPLQAALASTAVKGAGYYGIGRAEGMTPNEAFENAAVLSAFAGPELAGEALNAVIGRARPSTPSIDSATGRPMEPAVRSAIDSAFEVAGVSPELAEKALKTPMVTEPAIAEPNVAPLNSPLGTATTPAQQSVAILESKLADMQSGEFPTDDPNARAANTLDIRKALKKARQEQTIVQPVEPLVRKGEEEVSQGERIGRYLAAKEAGEIPSEPIVISKPEEKPSRIKVTFDPNSRLAQPSPQAVRSGAAEEAGEAAKAKDKQRGSFSNEPKDKMKLGPPGVKTGAVEDRPLDLSDITELGDIDTQAQLPQSVHDQADIANRARQFAQNREPAESVDFANQPYEIQQRGNTYTVIDRTKGKPEEHSGLPSLEAANATAKILRQEADADSGVQDLGDVDTPLGLTDKFKKQRGAVGEPPDAKKLAPPGVKTGAVDDLAPGKVVPFEAGDKARERRVEPAIKALEDAGYKVSKYLGTHTMTYAVEDASGREVAKFTNQDPNKTGQALIGWAREHAGNVAKKAEPIIGIVGSDGTVQGKPDPHRNLNHGSVFPEVWSKADHWHYEPSTETVYWTIDGANADRISVESRHAAENYLDRQGHAVARHAGYSEYNRYLNTIDHDADMRHASSDEIAARIDAMERGGEHSPTAQPRVPETGQFSHNEDFGAISTELFNAGNRMQDDYRKLADHPARRDLSTASDMSVRNYFRQLYSFVNTHSPEKLDLVRQAEDAQYAGDSTKATIFAERALTNTHEFVNKLSTAVMATKLLDKGIGLKGSTDWRGVLRTVREGKARAERGIDPSKWKGQEGFAGEKPDDMKAGPAGVRTGAVADLESARREKERRLPKHLERTEREPGDDTTYQELPNKLTKARVEKRIADQGIEATEAWYNKQETTHPEAGAELTDAFRQLSDHYLTKLANATDSAEITSLTTKAKELAGTEAPRSTGLGQAVQAYSMLDKYTGPEVLLEAQRLAERSGQALPDETVKDIAKTGQEFKEADTQLTEVRKELAKAEREAGKGAGKGPGTGINRVVSARRVEQLRDQQTKLIERRQQAKIRQEQTLKRLEQKPTKLNYYMRFNNILRGFMVSAIPTAVRNYETQGLRFGVERLTDLFAEGLRRTTSSDPHISMANLHRDTLRLFQSESRSKAVAIAGEFPRELNRLFSSYGEGQVESPAAQRTFAGRVEKAFGSVESFVQKINYLNQLQEFHIRGAEFLSHMDMLVEREHHMSLEQFLRERGADKLSKEMISDSIDHALEVTFADLPAKDTEIGKHMNSLIKLGNLIPPTVSPIPFARWFYNSWKFNYQFSPLGLADLARTPRQLREARRALQRIEVRPPARTEALQARRTVELEKARTNVTRAEERAKVERYRTVAKAAIGTTFLGVAYAARSSSLAGEKWYEMRVPGTEQTIDARPFAPFSTYLFVAEAARRSIHGERPFSKNEFFAALGSSTSATGGLEALYDKYRRGDFNSLVRAAQSAGADVGTAILTPIRQVRDILGEFDKSQSTTYDTSTQPFAGPLKTSIPYGERIGTPLPKAYQPTSDQPIHAVHPITKFLGPRIVTPKNFIQKEADRLRFDYNEVRPSTGVPQIDQLEEQWMGEYVGKQATKLGNNPNYARLPDSAKAELYLKPLFAAGRTVARARLASEHPDLYMKLIERSKSSRQRAMESDFGVKPLASPY